MTNTTFSDQFRFNSGYHDGAADVRYNRPNKWATEQHPSKAYRVGYLIGWNEQTKGEYTENSADAWVMARFWGDV